MDDSLQKARPLILASTSTYRRELLTRLGLQFEVVPPQVSEEHIEGETAQDRARRLAHAKAQAVAKNYPQAIVIGSDQVAALGDAILDKPGNASNTRTQLKALSGNTAQFYTACVLVGRDAALPRVHVNVTTVVFRPLSDAEITRYIAKEPAFDCAGGAKAEGLGISLVKRIESDDPTALIGLPLIWLAGALREVGFSVP